jgi:hypothetical protein
MLGKIHFSLLSLSFPLSGQSVDQGSPAGYQGFGSQK